MSDFRKQLEAAYNKKVTKPLEQTVRKLALYTDAELVRETPVDTGRARANWLPTINAKASGTVDPGGKPPIAAVIEKYKLTDTIWITNNLPYIQRLNEGHSGQAPAGFVDAIVQRGRAFARNITVTK